MSVVRVGGSLREATQGALHGDGVNVTRSGIHLSDDILRRIDTMKNESVGDTLVKTVEAGGINDARRLLRTGAVDADHMNEALYAAAGNGNVDMLRLIIGAGALGNRPYGGHTVLGNAAQYGHIDAMAFLLQAGADINLDGGNGCALYEACCAGQLDAAKFLIEHGASITGQRWCMPIEGAAEGGLTEMVRFFMEHGVTSYIDDDSALCNAASIGSMDIVRLLTSDGTTLKGQYNEALMHAAEEGHTEVAMFLISVGADANYSEDEGDDVLSRAAKYGHLDTIKALVQAGADVHAHDEDLIMMSAYHSENADLVNYLVGLGVEPYANDSDTED